MTSTSQALAAAIAGKSSSTPVPPTAPPALFLGTVTAVNSDGTLQVFINNAEVQCQCGASVVVGGGEIVFTVVYDNVGYVLDVLGNSQNRASGPSTGEYIFAAGNYLTRTGALLCNGGVYNVADYPDLGAYLGSKYGGDGVTTFGVPNFEDRFPMGAGGLHTIGETGGTDIIDHTLLPVAPPWTLSNDGNNIVTQGASGGGNVSFNTAPTVVTNSIPETLQNNSGGGQPFYPPFLGVYIFIKT